MSIQYIDRRIYIGGLPDTVNEKILYSVFLTFGDIKYVDIPIDSGNNKHKGFGFIEYEDVVDAVHAIDNMNEAELFGSVIKVQKARKTVGPLNKAIWEDKEYQDKYGEVKVEVEETVDIQKRVKIEKEIEEKEKKNNKPISDTQRLYELSKQLAHEEE